MTNFFILFHRPLRSRRKGRRGNHYFFAVDPPKGRRTGRTAKEISSRLIKIIMYSNTGGYLFIPQGCMFLLSALPVRWGF